MSPNLVCPQGHLHWSPEPDEWIDRSCGHGARRTGAGTLYQRGICTEPLRLLYTEERRLDPR